MKRSKENIAPSLYTLILLGTLAVVVTAVACSTGNAKPTVVRLSQPIGPTLRPMAPKSVAFTTSQSPTVIVADKTSSLAKTQPPKFITYMSHDYGVSFLYPWQYTHFSAKAVASDSSLQPQPDGFEGRVTLARVDVPKGFYPDTDFDNGYFTLSLNQDLGEEDCKSTLKADKDKVKTININGVDFRWIEIENGGKGSSAKIRDYVAYVNDTCYEIETGVKTTNDGLAREVDRDQVLRRLDGILMSVKIAPEMQLPAKQQLQSSKEVDSETGK